MTYRTTYYGNMWLFCCCRYRDKVPAGLHHLLVCTGSTRQAVYRGLYFTLKATGVGAGTKTFVFPAWVREIVRLRFPGGPQHDAQ